MQNTLSFPPCSVVSSICHNQVLTTGKKRHLKLFPSQLSEGHVIYMMTETTRVQLIMVTYEKGIISFRVLVDMSPSCLSD